MSAYKRGGDLYRTNAQKRAAKAAANMYRVPSQQTMTLVHLTNYWGTDVDPDHGRVDREVGFHCLWCQALATRNDNRICFSFGLRAVEVSETDLHGFDQGKWNLWKVSGRRGSKGDGHYFWKFVLIPQGIPGKGKANLQAKGWELLTDYGIDISNADLLNELTQIIDEYWNDDSNVVNHVHIGVFLNGQVFECPEKVHTRAFHHS